MTDKQIIDGIDVSGCEYYFDNKCRCMDASIMQDFYSCPQCNSNPNCYYKQYKRKEQECNQLKEENDKLKQYKSSKQASYEAMQIEWNEAKNEVKKLKAENDELKTEFDKFEEQIKLQGNFIDSFLFATKNSEWRNKSILEDEADSIIEKVESDYVQLEKYKQTLQEILDEARDGYSSGTQTSCENSLKQIIEKIEVLNV